MEVVFSSIKATDYFFARARTLRSFTHIFVYVVKVK